MASVYSSRFLFIAAAGVGNHQFTIPTGFTGVIREVTVLMNPLSSQHINVIADAPIVWYSGIVTTQTYLEHELRVVLPAGKTITVQVVGDGVCDLYVGGYLLSTP